MSTAATDHPADRIRTRTPAPGTTGTGVTWPRVVRSEWLKLVTLRSTLVPLAAAVVTMLVFGLVLGYNTRHVAGVAPEDAAPSGVLQGYYLAQLLLSALGVTFVSGEYATGSIRATFAAVPRRLPVLTAGAAVLAASVLVAMCATSVTTFVLGQGVIARYRPAASLTDPGVLRVVLGTGVYLSAVTLIGSAIGWLVRSTPGALVTAAGLILVLPGLTATVLGTLGQHVAAFLPVGAGAAFTTSAPVPGSLTPWHGLAVLLAWVTGLLALAATQLRRRDA